ncbi:HipA domain-containing protein [Ramlibacter sp.]|uniref:HipA domain-containing protein n=1 Tax=Ramlibacter sp. TaxID=1917967 RepID=UPI003D0EC91E
MQLNPEHQLILGVLATKGAVTSAELQSSIGKSQPTVSRLIKDLGPKVLPLGRGRATRYGLGKSIHGRPAQHTIWWTDAQGGRRELGTLSHLANDTIFVQSRMLGDFSGSALPWYLSPLRPEGFLGRMTAAAAGMASFGADADPARWLLETVLYAALQIHDAPGAMTLGVQDDAIPPLALSLEMLHQSLDTVADNIATTLPAGSSAGGEQPKFLAILPTGAHVIVKFSPPLESPGGTRWSDLLLAEHLACETLKQHGFSAATSHFERTRRRAYLISQRFDRVGPTGRRHVVSIGKAHEAFVQGTYRNWPESCAALVSRGCLSLQEAGAARTVFDFGRLIGNTDMHSGNLGLFVGLDGILRGRFELTPVYDMLPMRWRPDPALGGVQPYAPFAPDDGALASRAAPVAEAFWTTLSQSKSVTRELRDVASEMAARLRPGSTLR